MQIQIENLEGFGTSIPEDTTDVSGRPYLGWAVGNIASFGFRLPETYVVGTDLAITIEESTPGQSVKHKWSLDVSRELDTADTITEEVTSSAVADELTETTFDLSSSGQVSGTDLAVGDYVSVVMSRIAASASEDSNDIKVYTITVSSEGAEYADSGCLGRVGSIIDQVRSDFNDALSERISNAEIIAWCNRAVNEMAQANLFTKETALNLVADSGEIDLLTAVTDFVDAFTLRWHEDTDFMVLCRSWQQFKTVTLQTFTQVSTPAIWFVISNKLHFFPTYSEDLTSGLYLYHSYLPAEIGCLSGYTPEFPASFDPLLVAYALYRAHSKFYIDSSSPEKATEWYSAWEAGFRRLKRQANPPVLGFRPYR